MKPSVFSLVLMCSIAAVQGEENHLVSAPRRLRAVYTPPYFPEGKKAPTALSHYSGPTSDEDDDDDDDKKDDDKYSTTAYPTPAPYQGTQPQATAHSVAYSDEEKKEYPTPAPYHEEKKEYPTPAPYHEEKKEYPTPAPYHEEKKKYPTPAPYYEAKKEEYPPKEYQEEKKEEYRPKEYHPKYPTPAAYKPTADAKHEYQPATFPTPYGETEKDEYAEMKENDQYCENRRLTGVHRLLQGVFCSYAEPVAERRHDAVPTAKGYMVWSTIIVMLFLFLPGFLAFCNYFACCCFDDKNKPTPHAHGTRGVELGEEDYAYGGNGDEEEEDFSHEDDDQRTEATLY